jgi:drug/metabolite transporter (DMT)-like permease
LHLSKSTAKPFFELILAGALWGFGFVATVWCFAQWDIPAILFYRFAGAAGLGFLILKWQKVSQETLKKEARLALWPSFFLAMTLLFQTYGLAGTGATKSAFITTTYVVFVPLFSFALGIEKIRWIHWLWVALSLLGGFLTFSVPLNDWSWSEGLTGLNALAASAHILAVGKVAKQSQNSLAFNTWQSFFIAGLCLPLGIGRGHWSLWPVSAKALIGLLALTFGSSFLAFLLQIRAQKLLKPSLASLLFLLESPFSFVFAFLFLHESLNLTQSCGALLILLACAATIFTEAPTEKPPEANTP